MKNLLLALSLGLAIGTAITLDSCKKTSNTEDDSVSARDNATVTSAVNLTGDDASAVSGETGPYAGKTAGLVASLCGIQTIDSSGTIKITYDGTTHCSDLIRSGTITVALTGAAAWRDAAAVLTITYTNFTVSDLLGNTYTINGTQSIINVSGGLAWQIAYGVVLNDSVTHNRSANMTIKFPNGSTRTWSLSNFLRKWVGAGSVVTVTDYTSNGEQIITGVNRYGNSFTTSIISPLISDNTCFYFPYTGVEQHVVNNRTTTITYGTNSSGTQVGTAIYCAPGFYIQYHNANNGNSENLFVQY